MGAFPGQACAVPVGACSPVGRQRCSLHNTIAPGCVPGQCVQIYNVDLCWRGAQSRVALEALQAQVEQRGRGGAPLGGSAPSRVAMHVSLVLTTLCALWFFKHESVSSISRKIVSSVIFPVRSAGPALLRVAVPDCPHLSIMVRSNVSWSWPLLGNTQAAAVGASQMVNSVRHLPRFQITAEVVARLFKCVIRRRDGEHRCLPASA